jgi:hypothetical protein
MRVRNILPLVALAALAACNNGGSVTAENESTSSVAKKVDAANIKILPGRWESKMKMESLEVEGLPPEAKAAMSKQMGVERALSTCLTPEQVEKPGGGFFAGGAEDCTYKHFNMSGGKIDAEMTCGKQPGSPTMAMAGTYSESSYDLKVTTKTEMQPGKPMTMAMAVASRRTGDCDGKEDISAKDMKAMQEWSEKHRAE